MGHCRHDHEQQHNQVLKRLGIVANSSQFRRVFNGCSIFIFPRGRYFVTVCRCDIPVVFYRLNTIYITRTQNTTKFYCTVLYSMFYNYMFRHLFFRPSSGCICLALRVMYRDDKLMTLSSGYITLKAKQIQPDDGLKKKPKHVVVKNIVQYSTIKLCSVLTASYIYCIFLNSLHECGCVRYTKTLYPCFFIIVDFSQDWL